MTNENDISDRSDEYEQGVLDCAELIHGIEQQDRKVIMATLEQLTNEIRVQRAVKLRTRYGVTTDRAKASLNMAGIEYEDRPKNRIG